MNRLEEMMALVKSLKKDVTTSGVATTTGLNFYYLEQKAKEIYPVFYPLLQSIPRANPMFNGMRVGGTAVNWKALVGIDANGYPAVSEGNRNAYMKFTERDYSSTYKFLGKDTNVSFQAQQTGLGFEDNIALAQVAMLNALLNDEERMVLYGNSGPSGSGGNNGFALGTTPTPVGTNVTTGGAIANATTLTVYCIALTGWGIQLSTAVGLSLPFTRSNADGSQDQINGGTAIISAAATGIVATANTTTHVTMKVAAVVGALGYAWYVGTAAGTANAKFAGITGFPVADINDGVTAASVGSGTSLPYLGVATPQLANASNAIGSFTTDWSYNNLDFDGLLTWTANAASAAQPSYWKDLGGLGLTSNGDGTIKEFEDVADFLWNSYKLTYDKIYLGGNLVNAVSKGIMTAAAGPGAQRITFESNNAGQIVGGSKVVQYRSKYSTTGAAKVVDVVTHPWLPAGVVYFDLINNPYPAAGGAIPSVRRIMSLEDHFSIKWPYRNLRHELGVYCFETIEHYIPFGTASLTGVANKVN
jgi:hypothetical protein